MMIDANSINCYILIGGKSSRMGKDKASLDFKGMSFIEQISNAVRSHCDSIYNISSRSDHKTFNNLIEDVYLNIGPMGGIHTALSHTDKEWNLILSCDIPLIQNKTVSWLFENSCKNCDATIVEVNNKKNPLFGLYHKSCIQMTQKLIAKDSYRMMDLIDNINTKVVTAPDYLASTLTNVNTPSEYQKIIK